MLSIVIQLPWCLNMKLTSLVVQSTLMRFRFFTLLWHAFMLLVISQG